MANAKSEAVNNTTSYVDQKGLKKAGKNWCARTHGADVWNVETAGCDVSSHEHACFIFGEFVQVLQALPLLQPSMQGTSGHVEQLKETSNVSVAILALSTRTRRPNSFAEPAALRRVL